MVPQIAIFHQVNAVALLVGVVAFMKISLKVQYHFYTTYCITCRSHC
jgi:hypothetical protein